MRLDVSVSPSALLVGGAGVKKGGADGLAALGVELPAALDAALYRDLGVVNEAFRGTLPSLECEKRLAACVALHDARQCHLVDRADAA